MHLRHSPAVRYPLPKAPALWPWLVCLGAGLVVWWVVWVLYGAGFGQGQLWRAAVGLLVLTACVGLGWQAWQQWPHGHLHWSGRAWVWQMAAQTCALHGAPVVILDVQWMMVLAWRSPDQGWQRFVLLQRTAQHGWPDLRRAVYSPVHPAFHDAASQAL